MICKIEKINNLIEKFGYDNSLSLPSNTSILAKKFLINTLKTNGLLFNYAIGIKEKGKPFFINNKDVCFSISHCKDYVAIAVDKKEIGVDIELLREKRQALAQRFFTKEENIYLNKYQNTNYNEAFTQLWTMKESLVKQSGEGIANNFNKKEIVPKEFTFETTIDYNNLKIYSKFFKQENLFFSVCYFSSDILNIDI